MRDALAGANELFGGSEWIYLHDNGPWHAAASTQRELETLVPSFFSKDQWPGNSPDLNPIENVFGAVTHRVAELAPRNLAELDSAFRKAWREETTPAKLAKLFDSGPDRIKAVIRAKGGLTRF